MVIDEEGTKIVEDLPSAQLTEEGEIVEINLDQLEEMMAKEIEEGEANAADMLEREEVVEGLEEELDEEIELDEDINDLLEEEDLDEATIEIDDDKLAAAITGQLDEEIEIDEAQLADVIAELLSEEEDELGPDVEGEEKVEVVEEAEELKNPEKADLDKDGDLSPYEEKRGKAIEKAMANESKLLQKENKTLLREQKKMNNKVQLLETKVEKYGTVIEQLKEKLDESNLTNAKLLYQNRILNSISLNERQKDKIVEAISNATSVEEAKIIFETLQSAVGIKSKKTRKQESLNEVVTRSSSAFIPRKEVKPNTNAFSERMQRLAGLK
jgi:hypothetical protein